MTQNGKVAPTYYTTTHSMTVVGYHKPWIPDEAEELLQRLMVIAHCGRQGHRACLLCCHIKGGKIVPRPYGELYRSSERNEALHMDYIYIGKYNDTSDYILG
ncbi:hypothetical protein PHMEG_00031036 [Phytophthora megakarya]|uniref:Uncharacterized protein n=1 Tax=Phytophthora megakarya TaxID=4795 RepID=A0A225UYX9_9STRA|nr:hypothetical protein PHMEG_00031036 [Phytophthora megakarya]